MKTIIMSDSNCDLSQEYLRAHNIPTIPFSFVMDGVEYIDDKESIKTEDYYKKLSEGSMSQTSQITPFAFEEVFLKHIELGNQLIYIGFSSQLSQTLSNAVVAKQAILNQYPEAKIAVIDSISATNGQALLVDAAIRLDQEGHSFDKIVSWLEENKNNVNIWFTVDDLEHLRRGGRISGASAFIGKAAKIKPVMNMSPDGKLIPIAKVRTRKKSLKHLVTEFDQRFIASKQQKVFIHHGNCFEDAKYVEKLIKENHFVDVEINSIGPVIGAHTGEGVISLAYLGTARD